jgi:type I restriction enzyme S subunit
MTAGYKDVPLSHLLIDGVQDGPHETPKFIDYGVPFLSVDSIVADEINWVSPRYISVEEHERFAKKCRPQLGDVLLTKAASVGKVAMVRTADPFNVWSPIAVLRANPTILAPEFLAWALRSAQAQSQMQLVSTNSTQNNLAMSDIAALRIPLPPIDEQRRIADFLDDQVGRIDQAIELKNSQQNLSAARVYARRDSAVAGPKVKLRRVVSLLRDGTHASVPRASEGFPLLSVRNIQDGEFKLRDDDSRVDEQTYSEIMRGCPVQVGDVLLAIVGATLGKSAINELKEPFCLQRSVAVLRADRRWASNQWLLECLRTTSVQEQLWIAAGYSAQPGVYLGTVADLSIPIPTHQVQTEVLRDLNEVNGNARDEESLHAVTITLLEERKRSLITAAVTGQLDVVAARPLTGPWVSATHSVTSETTPEPVGIAL